MGMVTTLSPAVDRCFSYALVQHDINRQAKRQTQKTVNSATSPIPVMGSIATQTFTELFSAFTHPTETTTVSNDGNQGFITSPTSQTNQTYPYTTTPAIASTSYLFEISHYIDMFKALCASFILLVDTGIDLVSKCKSYWLIWTA